MLRRPLLLAIALLLGCSSGAPAAPPTAVPAPPSAPTSSPASPDAASGQAALAIARPEPARLKISHAQITSSAGNYVAADNGYFQEEGIEVDWEVTRGGSDLMAYVVSGQVDVGGGVISSGLFNAFARDIPLKVVADHGANLPNASAGGIVVRTDLLTPGAPPQPADLRGRKVAISTDGSTAHIALDRYLRAAGMTLGDVDLTVVPLADTLAAFENRAIDVSYWQEPFTTIAVDRGVVARGPIGYDIYPLQQIGGILFGPRLNGDRALGLRYLRAYVRGVRDYVKALQERDPAAFDVVVPILIKYTTVKERALFEKAIPSGLKPDPVPNVQSLIDDQEWYVAHGYVAQRVKVADFVDTTLVEQAIREVGPYR